MSDERTCAGAPSASEEESFQGGATDAARLRACLQECRYLLLNATWGGLFRPGDYLIDADQRTAAIRRIDQLLGEGAANG